MKTKSKLYITVIALSLFVLSGAYSWLGKTPPLLESIAFVGLGFGLVGLWVF